MIRLYQGEIMHARLVLWVACTAQLLVVLDVSVVNVALPSIQAELEFGPTTASWVAMAYCVTFAGVLLVAARLADALGAERVLVGGVAFFAVTSAAGGFATDGAMLIGARAGQGLAAAAISPATFTLLTVTYPEGRERTQAIAVWTAVSVAGGGVGNVVSGLLTELISWRAVLLINLPIGLAIVLAAGALARRAISRPRAVPVSLTAVALAIGGFTCAILALSMVGASTVSIPVATAMVSVVFFALLGLHQHRAAHPLVPPGLLRRRGIALGNIATFLTAACFQVGIWYFLTYRMQTRWDYTPLQAGLAFLPLTGTLIAVNLWVVPRLMGRIGARPLIVAGALTASLGLVWQSVAEHGGFLLMIAAPAAVIGAGGGLMNTPLAAVVTSRVVSSEAGAASGLMNTAKQFGGAMGLAAATVAVAAAGTDRVAFLLMAALLALVALVAVGLPAPGVVARAVPPPREPARP
ncbi:MFS transporter [Ruania halotolerans]|uniref:MFS transporter n=1 Tax=Ruania halotolerans TaxID=2897773 RepID=UPI001E5DAC37|nr:MFS transporter [Ruania halotolerans]UFU06119.1 MFS transporter [Ruania halotolerans]